MDFWLNTRKKKLLILGCYYVGPAKSPTIRKTKLSSKVHTADTPMEPSSLSESQESSSPEPPAKLRISIAKGSHTISATSFARWLFPFLHGADDTNDLVAINDIMNANFTNDNKTKWKSFESKLIGRTLREARNSFITGGVGGGISEEAKALAKYICLHYDSTEFNGIKYVISKDYHINTELPIQIVLSIALQPTNFTPLVVVTSIPDATLKTCWKVLNTDFPTAKLVMNFTCRTLSLLTHLFLAHKICKKQTTLVDASIRKTWTDHIIKRISEDNTETRQLSSQVTPFFVVMGPAANIQFERRIAEQERKRKLEESPDQESSEESSDEEQEERKKDNKKANDKKKKVENKEKEKQKKQKKDDPKKDKSKDKSKKDKPNKENKENNEQQERKKKENKRKTSKNDSD